MYLTCGSIEISFLAKKIVSMKNFEQNGKIVIAYIKIMFRESDVHAEFHSCFFLLMKR